jgi:hypothetical protein
LKQVGEDSEGDAEEWDRHEALHDDVDSQVMFVYCQKKVFEILIGLW